MSYRWRQETSPITSLLVLQRAIVDCGFEIIGTSNLMEKIILARQRVSNSTNTEEKITAYDELAKLIKECNETSQLPELIILDKFELQLKNYRYVVKGYSPDSSKSQELAAIDAIRKLNNSYRKIANNLQDELEDAMASSSDLKLRQTLVKLVKLEQESYKTSVKAAKEKIFQIIQENAKKEGYSVKRNVFTKGKNAGREQYVVVKRS